MQCPNCKFNNMPGTTACGRCSSMLDANSVAIDVHPPRASGTSKQIRKLTRGLRLNRAGDVAHRAHTEIRESVRRRGFQFPTMAITPRMIVPGWALIHVGEGIRGWFFFGLAAFLLFLGFFFFGSAFGGMCLGLAFGVHVGSCVSFLRQGGFATRDTASCSLVAIAGLLLFVYFPGGWLVSRFVTPVTLDIAAAPFANGDVVLVNPRAFVSSQPKPGDITLHRQARQGLRGRGYEGIVIAEGEVIDRILAQGGDKATWENGKLWVNGHESELRPLNPDRMPDKITWDVPPGHVLVVPTTSVAIDPRITVEAWKAISLVPTEDILGRVYFRTYPLSRWGRIR